MQIPVIDLSSDNVTLHEQLKDAVESIGFFYIQNTIISPREIEDMFALSRSFYENDSNEEKRQCHHISNKGYGSEEV